MSELCLQETLQCLNLAVFAMETSGHLTLLAPPPSWVLTLWPQLSGFGGTLRPETSPFLDNFMVDAADAWTRRNPRRVTSGMWLESDDAGRHYHLQANAFRAAGRAIL